MNAIKNYFKMVKSDLWVKKLAAKGTYVYGRGFQSKG